MRQPSFERDTTSVKKMYLIVNREKKSATAAIETILTAERH
jgi:hypothetical protein